MFTQVLDHVKVYVGCIFIFGFGTVIFYVLREIYAWPPIVALALNFLPCFCVKFVIRGLQKESKWLSVVESDVGTMNETRITCIENK